MDNTTADKAEIWFDSQLEAALEFVSILHGAQHAPLTAAGIIHILSEFPEIFDHEEQAEAANSVVDTTSERKIAQFGVEVLELLESDFGNAPPPRTPNGENSHEFAAYHAATLLRRMRQAQPEKFVSLAINVCVLLALSYAAG